MNSYATEAGKPVKAALNFNLGDKVKVSSLYLSHYPGISDIKDKEAEIIRITKRTIKASELSKEERHLYTEAYGILTEYNVIGLYIKYSNNKVFLVSPFGVEK